MEPQSADTSHRRRPVVVLVLAAAIVAVFVALVAVSGTTSPPTRLLVAAGALTSTTLQTGQYWRLVAAGFLHANPIHILGNLQVLFICGPVLERRLGSAAFIFIYAAALIGGGLTSLALHPGFYVGVGASGAMFGLLGALFALWVLGRLAVPASFFLVNFGLNAAFAFLDQNIDWAAHLGGFVTGLACIALLIPVGLIADRQRPDSS